MPRNVEPENHPEIQPYGGRPVRKIEPRQGCALDGWPVVLVVEVRSVTCRPLSARFLYVRHQKSQIDFDPRFARMSN
jgi:hypothetical protein